VRGFWKRKELLKGKELLASLRAETFKKAKENMGQCKSEHHGF
jgi:hypothetical protein